MSFCSGRTTSERLPVGPLLAASGMAAEPTAIAAGFSRRTGSRWRRSGLMPLIADEAAVAFGLHPMDVWGDLWLAGAS